MKIFLLLLLLFPFVLGADVTYKDPPTTYPTIDVNGGTVDGAVIGGTTPAAGTFTTLNASGGGALTGTWTNLGSVTTVDINGGTIDGATIGASSATTGVFTTIRGTELIANPRVRGMVVNCEMNVSGSTLTISGKDGVALSATNPCEIGVNSLSYQPIRATFTANVTATFGATSDTDGNLFGITDANWASVMPMMVGVIHNGTTAYFTLSRIPISETGATATICKKTETDCDGATDVMILDSSITVSDFQFQPVTNVGWIQATYATTGGAWTFSEGVNAGFNQLYGAQRFVLPQGQMGALAGTHFIGATAPLWTTSLMNYSFDQYCNVRADYYASGDPGTDGSTTAASQVALPYLRPSGAIDDLWLPIGLVEGATTITAGQGGIAVITENTSYMALRYLDAAAATASVTNAMFSNGTRNVRASVSYNACSN